MSPKLMLVGEIPGDVEDKLGHPFVGPAGKLLSGIMQELGIDPKAIYLTNAVKHFKYVRMGKRRLHQKPNSQDIHACRPWLIKEIEALQPAVILALGGTAAASLCDHHIGIQRERSKWLTTPFSTARVLATWHPSAILRSPDPVARKAKREQLKDDLKQAWRASGKAPRS